MYKILDISTHQKQVDYRAVAKSVDGVILRIGYTGWGFLTKHNDAMFETHYAGFKAVGVPVGAYYYSCAPTVDEAKKEAEFCLQLLRGKQFELPIYYDVENPQRQEPLSKSTITAITDTFCSILEKAGYFAGYYSYFAWLSTKFDLNKLSKYTLWLADYRANYDKTIDRDIHQYTREEVICGIAGGVDMSVCTRDFAAVIKKLGLNGFGTNQGLESKIERLEKELAVALLERDKARDQEKRIKQEVVGTVNRLLTTVQ